MTSGWSDVNGSAVDVNAVMAEGVEVLRQEFDITVVVKPHPQDAESRRIPGALVVTNDDLSAVGLQLYELIGASRGLLTDYSSVWVDYLALDRPVGFVVPDEDDYTRGRGFDPPDAPRLAAGTACALSMTSAPSAKRSAPGGSGAQRDAGRLQCTSAMSPARTWPIVSSTCCRTGASSQRR